MDVQYVQSLCLMWNVSVSANICGHQGSKQLKPKGLLGLPNHLLKGVTSFPSPALTWEVEFAVARGAQAATTCAVNQLKFPDI